MFIAHLKPSLCSHCESAYVNDTGLCWHCAAGEPIDCKAGWSCKCGFRERRDALDAQKALWDSIEPGWDRN